MWSYIIYTSSAILATIFTGSILLFYTSPKHIMFLLLKLQTKRCGMSVKFVGDENYMYCYGERGSKNPKKTSILMIHGFSASKDMFLGLYKRLPSDVHLISMDLPGHGSSFTPKPDDEIGLKYMVHHIHRFVKLVGLYESPFHLIGTSLGGAIVGHFTMEYPELVDRLSLICPAMKTPEESIFSKTANEALLKGIENVEYKDLILLPVTPSEGQKMFDCVVYHKQLINKQVLQGLMDLRKPKNEFFLSLFKALAKEDCTSLLEDKASEIKCPTQIIWGKHDEVIDVSGAEVLHKKLANCKHIDIIERAGHSILLDRPGALTKSLLVFRGEYS
ncbi:hypothetical protein LOTGIDRAFT_231126 [Lottia gigantea]|uniref:acylglycerol lipase n=1 Tax=Lottia gigantea TaxID=225164 RepID=V4A6I9_LOTGI|nr:hypothetical protein LOTGIDRAFT_231126 [Lottia gigantea]ESO99543.1 hypothetical protein LOTGIDRAFT_231126 [Lottia gigantea]